MLRLQAGGVLIYECRGRPAGHGWTVLAPEAVLFNEQGATVGTLHAGPTFQWADGSLVRVASGPGVLQPGAVLPVRQVSATGRLASVTAIVTLQSSGGAAPGLPCDATHAGRQARVDFSALYAVHGRP
ncbi:DUF3455 domain-containing protein [Eleftheria terrae]|uniref:DUF3455 domain-containing protein n=1 Tax=Eleftheria terrae TaxID=1597781 RepID=UPI00263AD5A3|nr:DUF3455 domain-containing protein [Eleftheria terrae]WKB53858.1 DUF3455 domain-containing protein [Eleftheria terrae]